MRTLIFALFAAVTLGGCQSTQPRDTSSIDAAYSKRQEVDVLLTQNYESYKRGEKTLVEKNRRMLEIIETYYPTDYASQRHFSYAVRLAEQLESGEISQSEFDYKAREADIAWEEYSEQRRREAELNRLEGEESNRAAWGRAFRAMGQSFRDQAEQIKPRQPINCYSMGAGQVTCY